MEKRLGMAQLKNNQNYVNDSYKYIENDTSYLLTNLFDLSDS